MLLLRLLAVHNRAAAALSCPARPVAAMAASSPPPHAGLRPAADVLTFWFGPAFANERAALSSAPYFSKETVGRWWGAGGPGFDAQCAAFADTIRAVGSGALDYGDDADGRLAAILLCDQLSRGAFRGSPEAFAYDATALRLSRAVCAAGQDAGMSAAARQFAYMPLMHSEELADQELSVAKSEALSAEFAASIPYFKDSGFARSHWEVVARFGRFPHRNAAKGRASTAEEAAWLAGPGVPGWARSQG